MDLNQNISANSEDITPDGKWVLIPVQDDEVMRVPFPLVLLSEVLTEIGKNSVDLDLPASHDFGYILEWDSNQRIKVGWHNMVEFDGDMSKLLYPDGPWGPGDYATSSAGMDGGVAPQQLIDICYLIFSADDTQTVLHGLSEMEASKMLSGSSDAQTIQTAIECVKGIADTENHAKKIVEWCAKRGQKVAYTEVLEQGSVVKSRGWAGSIKEVDSNFSGYEIQFTITACNDDEDYCESFPLGESFFWRTDPQLHKNNFSEFWDKSGDVICTDEGMRRVNRELLGEDASDLHYEYAAYSIKDGKYAELDDHGCAVPAFVSDTYDL
jgi:hypothetical protein